ncbi:MAG TPA: SRPBCC family protein [Candidatus Aquilonibacter sp.]|nr:SRPBCC family protein [Candidatus Aquilonibacter sp.]
MRTLRCWKWTSVKIALIALLVGLPQGFAAGDVMDSAANGFTVKISANIHAAPADVFSHIMQVGQWWNPEHTYSGDAHNLSIEGHPGGCFCERLGGQGSVRHMEVIFVAPGKVLRFTGGLGPLQSLAATGTLTFSLAAAEDGTKLDVTYAVGGYFPQGMNTLAAPVNEVLTEQINRLKSYIETGSPAAKESETKPQ